MDAGLNFRAGKILLIDDDHDIVKVVESRLKAHGYQVAYAYSGEEGLRKAAEYRPDLIILDILMPGMDGTAVASALKQNALTKDIPVIFLTCLVGRSEERDTHHVIGGNIFFSKPFKGDELLEKIAELIKNKR